MVEECDPLAGAAACDLLDMLTADRRSGRTRPLAAYLALFPDHQERVAQEFRAVINGLPATAADHGEKPVRANDRIGGYRIRRLLGRGGQGSVYLAEDLCLHREVALKILTRRIAAVDSMRLDRLRREAAILARVDHPGVCAVYEAEFSGDRPFLAMRFVPGESLATRIHAAGRQPAAAGSRLLARLPRTNAEVLAVTRFIERVAHALHAVHRAGVIHRDINPANIMVDCDDRPVVLDFGLACAVAPSRTHVRRTEEVFGTLAYMSPEQLAGEDVDPRTDVYSLGVTLQECLTLVAPFGGVTRPMMERAIRRGRRRDPTTLNPAIPPELCSVLAKAMDPDPIRRHATASAIAAHLAAIREHLPIQACATPTPIRAQRGLRRRARNGSVSATAANASPRPPA